MKYLQVILLGFILCISITITAQQDQSRQVVIFLDHGSRITGDVVEWKHGEYITIETDWDDEIKFPWKIVKKVVQSSATIDKGRSYNFREQGLYISPAAAIITGNGGNRAKGHNGVSVSISAGHRINKYLAVGGGFGWDQYIWNSGEELIPLFAEFTGYTGKSNTSFRYALQAGYSIAMKDEDYLISKAKGGWMLYPALGIRFGNNHQTKYFFDIGYKFQRAEFSYDDPWEFGRRRDQRLLYKRLTIRFGLLL